MHHNHLDQIYGQTEPWKHIRMSLAVYFIRSDFIMNSRYLQSTFFSEDHTGEAVWTEGVLTVVVRRRKNWTKRQCFGPSLYLAMDELCIKECAFYFILYLANHYICATIL